MSVFRRRVLSSDLLYGKICPDSSEFHSFVFGVILTIILGVILDFLSTISVHHHHNFVYLFIILESTSRAYAS